MSRYGGATRGWMRWLPPARCRAGDVSVSKPPNLSNPAPTRRYVLDLPASPRARETVAMLFLSHRVRNTPVIGSCCKRIRQACWRSCFQARDGQPAERMRPRSGCRGRIPHPLFAHQPPHNHATPQEVGTGAVAAGIFLYLFDTCSISARQLPEPCFVTTKHRPACPGCRPPGTPGGGKRSEGTPSGGPLTHASPTRAAPSAETGCGCHPHD